MGSWREELVARVQAAEAGELVAVALLVGGTERLVVDAAEACGVLPRIDGVECQEVAPGVIRATVAPKHAAAGALSQLRDRLDAKSVASAVEWVGSAGAPLIGAAPAVAAAPEPVPASAPAPAPAPPPNPLDVSALAALGNSGDFLAEGWTAHKVIAKGTVDLWRKPVEGAAIDAVKVRGTVVPLGIGISGVAALMKNIDIKIELSKSTPSPIGVIEKLDSTTCMLSDGSGEEIVVDLFYQENKFPWPLSNRHACFVACSRRLPDGRYIFIESTVEHDECRRRAGSDGVVWKFVNTIMLEQSSSSENVSTTVSSSFDIGGDIPMSVMNALIEDMAGLFKDWNNLLDKRPPMVEQLLDGIAAQAREDEEEAAAAAAAARLAISAAEGTEVNGGEAVVSFTSLIPAVNVSLAQGHQFAGCEDMCAVLPGRSSIGRPELRAAVIRPTQLSIVVLGEHGAGNTSLITRLRTGRFTSTTKRTVGADGVTHVVDVPGYKCKVRVWDCALIMDGRSSSELQQVITRLIRRADIVMVTYEEPTPSTCANIKLVQETLEVSKSSALVVGVMTKADKKKKRKGVLPPKDVVSEIVRTLAGLQQFVTSAKTGYGVAHLFETIVGQVCISRSWQPGHTAAAQRLAWARACSEHSLPAPVSTAVARCLYGGCTPWAVVGQTRIDNGANEASLSRWKYAMYDLAIACAIFRAPRELRAATEVALLHCVCIEIPRAELVTDSATGNEHTSFVLRCWAATGAGDHWAEQFVSRRYSEFVALHAALRLRAPGSALASLPAKRASRMSLSLRQPPPACHLRLRGMLVVMID